MTDENFWTLLEYVACDWLRRSEDKGLRRFWVDGFTPISGKNSKRGLDVEGVAWIGNNAREQNEFHFVVSIPQRLLSGKKRQFEIEKISLDDKGRTLALMIKEMVVQN